MDARPRVIIAAAGALAAGVVAFRLLRRWRERRGRQRNVWVCGEVLIDRLPAGDDSGRRVNVVGGGAANSAKALARLGLGVQFIDGLSSDEYGLLASSELVGAGVDLSLCLPSHKPTCLATVSLDEQKKASYEFLIEGTATFDFHAGWLPDFELHRPQALHIGTLGTIIEPGASAILEWATVAAERGLPIVYDPNIRPPVEPDRKKYQKAVERFARISTVVKASDDDVQWLYPSLSLMEVARKWLECKNMAFVIITKGEAGITCVLKDGSILNEPCVKVEVKDTVGAGDTVGAVIVEGLVRYGAAALAADTKKLREVLKRANEASAITCSREGCQPPTAAELY